jgi:chromosome segregation ATPase
MVTFFLFSCASSKSIPPSVYQNLTDAKTLVEQARISDGEKYAHGCISEAQKYISLAEEAIKKKDMEKATIAIDIAGSYAHLARSESELQKKREELKKLKESLEDIEAKINELQKSK